MWTRLREVETHCGETYAAYKKALKKNWHQIDEVRKEQAAFEDCWREFKQYNKVPIDGIMLALWLRADPLFSRILFVSA